MTALLNDRDIQARMQTIPGWTLEGKQITCLRTFENFIDAIAFVNKLVGPAEAAGHHPDLEISYNKVKISLTSHDAGGLTEKDFSMAKTLSGLS